MQLSSFHAIGWLAIRVNKSFNILSNKGADEYRSKAEILWNGRDMYTFLHPLILFPFLIWHKDEQKKCLKPKKWRKNKVYCHTSNVIDSVKKSHFAQNTSISLMEMINSTRNYCSNGMNLSRYKYQYLPLNLEFFSSDWSPSWQIAPFA